MNSEITSLLDEERIRVQHLQPMGVPIPLSPSPINPTLDSSIKPAEASETLTPKYRPKLEHPALPAMRVFGKAEASASRQAELFDLQIKADIATIDRLNEEKETSIQEFLEKEKSKKTWGMLTTIMQYFGSAGAGFLAVACLATGQVAPGVLLLLSSVTGIADRVMRDLDLYKKVAAWAFKSVETQNKVVSYMEWGAFLTTFTAGLAGGFWAYGAGALGNSAMDQLGKSFQLGTSLMGGGFRLKQGHLEKQIGELQKKMKLLEVEVDTHYQNIDENSFYGKRMMETLSTIGHQLKNTIYSCSRAAAAA